MTSSAFPLTRTGLSASLVIALSGCASVSPPASPAATVAAAVPAAPTAAPKPATPPATGTALAVPATPSAAAPNAPGAAPGAAPAARPPATPPGTPAPFAEVTKDAKSSPGFLTVWTKDEKTWLEIPAAQLDKPFFLGSSAVSGLGVNMFYPGLMGGAKVVMLKRVGNSVQLIQLNTLQRAPDNTPLSRAVRESYSDSLLAAVPLAAAAHPERKSLLVDAQALLGGDMEGIQTILETAFRLPYALDRANSSIERTRASDLGTSITVRGHYSVPKLPAPPVLAPGAPPPNPASMPNPPSSVPDPRSFFLTLAYTLAPLPAQPMKPRLADARVGYFVAAYTDFGNDLDGDSRVHMIRRWRLEKMDPAAEVSDVKEPVRVIMDRNIPPQWRPAVRAGILEWNKAFEKAGLRGALAVEQQGDDADWSALEGTRMLAVRWFAMEGPGATAVGPSQSDPRTGEILRGAAIIPENWVRFGRNFLGDRQPRLLGQEQSLDVSSSGTFALGLGSHTHGPGCTHAQDALEHMQFGLELLESRGMLDPRGPDGEKYINDSLKDVVMHEVGHALGLRHNFKASTGITRAQLRDKGFTQSRGISNSVMDYNPPNIPLDGEAVSEYQMTALGAYDYFAIEYGYRPFPADQEREQLLRLAARGNTESALLYGTDEDSVNGDPAANLFDSGDDPVLSARRELTLARELWAATAKRELAPDDDMTVLRRNLQRGLIAFGRAVPLLTKQIGGVSTSRVVAGSKQPVFSVVDAKRQREALDTLLNEVLASTSFRFDPAFISRLGVDHVNRLSPGRFIPATDFSVPGAVLGVQRPLLDTLMSDGLAARMADNESKVAKPGEMPSYAEVQGKLSAAVWSELRGSRGGEIDTLRRNLQREHLKRLAAGLVRPSSTIAADVRAVHRQEALALEAALKKSVAQGGWSSMARAHLADSLAVLSEALRAPLMRQGV